MKTAVIAGHTGLIGKQLLSLLLEDDHYAKVYALGRSQLELNHPKLTQIKVDFQNIKADIGPVDDVFCCLGTTMKKAGSKEQFRLVDYQYPINLAQFFLQQGATKFALVSSMGADKTSLFFYNKVKGEVEEAIGQSDYAQIDIYRPSLLLGSRGESRLAEDAGKVIMKGLGFLFLGPLKHYKAIDSSKVARAMRHFAQVDNNGLHVHLSGELQEF